MQTVWATWGAIEGWLLSLPAWQAFPVVILASLAAAWVIQVGGDAVIRRLTVRIDGDVDDVILRTLHPPLYVTVVIVGTYLAVRTLGLAPTIDLPLRSGALTVVAVIWAVTLTRLGRRVSKAATEGDAFDSEVVPIFQNVWTALVVGVGSFFVLSLWRVDVTPLLASAGIIGIIVGLAARDTIANFFGSIALYADGTYKVGDYIVLDSGERGRVEDISIRSTVIRTRDDMLVTVPNSVLNSARITNESTPRRERRVRIPLGVAYDSDLERVEAVLLDVAADEDLVIDRPKPRVRYREFGDSAVTLELLGWIGDPVLRGRVTHRLVKRVHTAFREEGIEIPFPQRELSFKSDLPAATATAAGPDTAPADIDDAGGPTDGERAGDD
jgi:small-conductance mechanosensitive channel